GYASAFTFKYSIRPGTPGALMEDQVEEAVKTERLAALNSLIAAQMHDFGKSVVGRTLDVLIEKPGRMPGQVGGRSPYLQAVHMAGSEELIGSVQQVLITSARNNSIEGKIVTHAERNPASVLESQVA
ncbi:MAG TPA: TRAM domain-containing protein, partial [Reyranella sp.]|nr:TRAM domain-containing protein [Reyranella sp.]